MHSSTNRHNVGSLLLAAVLFLTIPGNESATHGSLRHADPPKGSLVQGGKPNDAPLRWKGLIGEYALAGDTIYVLEKDQQLHLLTKTTELYRLREQSGLKFSVDGRAFRNDTTIVFRQTTGGRAEGFLVTAGEFRRASAGGENGSTFKIKPLKPVTILKRDALNATPPKEEGEFLSHNLVEVTSIDSTIKLDIRYATTNNFMSAIFYSLPRAFLQRPAAEALVRAHRSLRERGYGLLIFDAYRPWYVTKMFWDATPSDKKIFVADPLKGSRHNRGCAVDLSLYELDSGKPVEMVSGYDEFSDRAFPQYQGGTSLQRWHRELLRKAMEAEGFNVYDWEWWHFDYRDWKRYSIGTKTFDELRSFR